MDSLLSMVVPMETLEGWPEAPEPSFLDAFGLLMGWPFIATVLIVAWVLITFSRDKRRGHGSAVEPEWLGGRPAGSDGGGDDPDVEAATSNKTAATRATADTEEAERTRSAGGASARW